MNADNKWTIAAGTTGEAPPATFGHTVSSITKTKIVLFGGAVGDSGKYTMINHCYLLNLFKNEWTKLQRNAFFVTKQIAGGQVPPSRAAHAATEVDRLQMVIYGGAVGGGGLAPEDLYLLDLKKGEAAANWVMVKTQGKTPGKRYGHTLSFVKPYLVVFGGQAEDNEIQNDTWVLSVEKMPFAWEKLVTNEAPPERIYHTATLCYLGQAAGMLIIFGGRATDQNPLNDAWGLRKDGKSKKWEWIKAPYKRPKIPLCRFQHSAVCVDKSIVVVGGRSTSIGEILQTECYDTETFEWTTVPALPRFRHAVWVNGLEIYAFGGFEQSLPTSPIASLVKYNLGPPRKESCSPIISDSVQKEETKVDFPKAKPKTTKSTVTIPQAPVQPITALTEFHFCPTALIAISFTPDLPSEQQKTVRVINIDKLQEESKKLLPENRAVPHIRNPYQTKDNIVNMFLNCLMRPKEWSMEKTPESFMFKPECVVELAQEFQRVVASQPVVLKVRPPVKIFGDIHGQYQDLMRFFDLWRGPTDASLGGDIDSYDYLFLGDYVDHGLRGLETICLLMALKVKYPDQVHLLRGNHEDVSVNSVYGFGEECVERLNEKLEDPDSVFRTLNSVFAWLPLAATIEDKIICVHGGIGEKTFQVEELNNIARPLEVPKVPENSTQQLVVDVLWSDPCENDNEVGTKLNIARDPKRTRNVHKFGSDKVEEFLKKNKMDLMIRSHECVSDGIERYAKGTLLTVFSAPAYCGRYKNAGAMLVLQKNYEIVPKLIYPLDKGTGWVEDGRRGGTAPRKFSYAP